MSNYKFSGHETFQCRHFWLKKGYDFVRKNGDFKSNEAPIDLGVGKNMITAINHWLKVFGLTDYESGELTEFAHRIFGEDSYDPYLEDVGSLHLLHLNILNNPHLASIYAIVFGEFRKTRISSEFTEKQLFEFITRKLVVDGFTYSENTIHNDIKVFLRTYQTSSKRGSKSIEDDFSSALIGLNLIDVVQDVFIDGEQVYCLKYNEQTALDELIFLYAILDAFTEQESISFEDVQLQVSDKFLCNREGTEDKLNSLAEIGYIVYKQDAGRKEIQLKNKLTKWDVLDKYYGRV